jgi:prolyl oligopeptidase
VSYPPTPERPIVDEYGGTRVTDPYRWMEDLDSAEVADWIAAQNAVTSAYLDKIPVRDRFRQRLTELWNYPRTGVPVLEAGRYFYQRNSGLQRQSPLFVRHALTGEPLLVLDPNALSPDGSKALAQWQPSPDGRLVAFGLSEGGADWETLHVREVETGRDLPDAVEWMRFSGLSWTKDSKGFFYSRYPEPPKGKVLEAALSGQALYYHRVGTPQSDDRLVYERRDLPTWFVEGSVTEDGRYLLITLSKGSENKNRLYAADLGDPLQPSVTAAVRPIVEGDDAEFLPIGNRGTWLYVRTDREAPNRRIVAIDLTRSEPAAWREIVPGAQDAIEDVVIAGGRLVIQYLSDVQSRLALVTLDGAHAGAIALPGTGTVAQIGGREGSPEIFYAFTSPLYPTTVFRFDPATGQSEAFDPPAAPIDASRYETRALFATSRDGTRIPLFLTARRDLPRDGSHPTMLYGYGGFSVSTLPAFRPDVPAWLELGGIWVTANIRGGAESGEAWHEAGMREKKQNVFDDFIAAGEFLIREKYTAPARLGIMGGSNGGLLVAAVEQQRPDLFAVALPAAGVLDMLRYDRFTGGHAWVTEYGSASDPSQFPFLMKYSPVQNAKAGTCYPATLVTTADHDDRVVPAHSFKYAAALQASQAGDAPALILIDTRSGHGASNTKKAIEAVTDVYAFVMWHLGVREWTI